MVGVLIFTVSALWQSTGVAKAQKQIQTIPTSPTPTHRTAPVFPQQKSFPRYPPHQSQRSHSGGSLCTASVLYSAH